MTSFGGLLGASSRGPEEGFGVPFGGSWDPFRGLLRWVCDACEKMLRRNVFRCESQRASIAKTGKPYSTSSENRRWARDGVHLLSCTHNAFIFLLKDPSVAPKLTTQCMLFGRGYKSWILDALGPVWSSTLGSFWRARRGTQPPKIGFFLTPAASE